MSHLVFIDTNIWLDFYRFGGREGDLKVLERVTHNLDILITTDQVELEFKKNRQAVLSTTRDGLRLPSGVSGRVPPFLAAHEEARDLLKHVGATKQAFEKLAGIVQKVMLEPASSDPVYIAAEKCFRAATDWNLTSGHTEARSVHEAARLRFEKGAPPRKDRELAFGDAINWEWILRCAKRSGHDVVVVSRDSDYGLTTADAPHINDWLREEFTRYTEGRCKVSLTERLTEALKVAGVDVTSEEETAEDELLKQREAEIAANLTWAQQMDTANVAALLYRHRARYNAALYNTYSGTPLPLLDAAQKAKETPPEG